MRVFLILPLALAGSACQPDASTIPYGLRAVEAPNPKLPEEEFYLPEARKLLPTILQACGIFQFREMPGGEQGEVVLQFDMPSEQERTVETCVKERAPNGVFLGPAYTL